MHVSSLQQVSLCFEKCSLIETLLYLKTAMKLSLFTAKLFDSRENQTRHNHISTISTLLFSLRRPSRRWQCCRNTASAIHTLKLMAPKSFFFFLVYHLLIGAQSLKQRFRSAEQVAALNCKHNFIRSAGYSARMLLHCSTTLPSRRSANFLTHFFGDVNRELIAQINFLSKLAEAPPHSILRVSYTPLWAIQYMDTTKISMAYLSE